MWSVLQGTHFKLLWQHSMHVLLRGFHDSICLSGRHHTFLDMMARLPEFQSLYVPDRNLDIVMRASIHRRLKGQKVDLPSDSMS